MRMTYAMGHPIRPVAGRLVLNFLNTADWSDQGEVLHEKIKTHEDLAAWLAAVGLPHAALPARIAELHRVRSDMRAALRHHGALDLELGCSQVLATESDIRALPLFDLVAISAAALLADPREMARLKTCDGPECGWMFIDETKNSRRRWCTMETCGNRAKAARHYKRSRKAASASVEERAQ